jgi:hypothetical protein
VMIFIYRDTNIIYLSEEPKPNVDHADFGLAQPTRR